MNNLEWLYEHDEAFAYGANKFVVDDGYSCCETIDQAHRWLLSEHETNGIDGETNGIAADSPLVEPCTSEGENVQGLPDENVSYLLRDVAKKSDGHTLYHGTTKLMQAIGKEPEDRRETGSELAIALNTLADMVERDYVKLSEYERATRDAQELYLQVEAERDEWKAKADKYQQHMWEFSNWHTATAKLLGIGIDPENLPTDDMIQGEIELRIIKLLQAEAKSAKRAAAVERLRMLDEEANSEDIAEAMIPEGASVNGYNWTVEIDAIIDLLTDEPMDAQRDSNGTCPVAMGQASDETTTCNNLGGNVTHDSREQLEADCEKLISKIRERIFSGRDETALRYQIHELLDRQAAITERECCKYIDGAGCDGPEVVHGLNGRIAELQMQVNELLHENTMLHAQCYERDGVTATAKIQALLRENANLARDLGECMADRDRYRALVGQMLDAAHEMRRIADANMPEGAVL